MKLMVAGFTKETGIKVDMRNGEDFELANQIVAGGQGLPGRRVRHRELPGHDPGRRRQGLRQVDAADARPGARRSSPPKDGNWVGFAARSTVLVYNTTQLKPAQLPASILDLAKPRVEGQVGIAAAGADFQAIVSAVVALKGEAKASSSGSTGLKDERQGLPRQRRRHAGGRTTARSRRASSTTTTGTRTRPSPARTATTPQLHFFGNKDPGAFLSASPAPACSPASKHQKQAQQLRDVPERHGGPEDPRRQHRAGVPDRQGRRPPTRRSSRSPSSTRRRSTCPPSTAQQGHRADAAGRSALSIRTERGPPATSRRAGAAGFPPRCSACCPCARRRCSIAWCRCLVRRRLHRQHRLGRGVRRCVVRPRVGELLSNTGRLVVGCMLLSAVIGTAAAWLVERTDLPGRGVWHILLVAPLAVPAFVNSFGWVSLTSRVEGFGGALLVVTLSYYPLVLPARRRGAARPRPGPGGDRPRSSATVPWRTFARVIAAAAAAGDARRRAAGRRCTCWPSSARCSCCASHLHHGDLRPVPLHLQRPRGDHAGQRAGRCAACCCCCSSMRVRGHAPLRPGRRRRRPQPPAATARPLVRCRCWPALTLLVGLALGVPMGSLVHWLVVGSSTAFPVGELVSDHPEHARPRRCRRGARPSLLALPVAWLAVRHRSGFAHPHRAQHLLQQRAARHRGRARAGDGVACRWRPRSTRPSACCSRPTRSCSCPRAMVSLRAALAQAPPVLDDVGARARAPGRRRRSGGSPCRSSRRVSAPGRRWCSSRSSPS